MFWKAVLFSGIGIQCVFCTPSPSIITFSGAGAIYKNANADVLEHQLALHPTQFSALSVWVSLISGAYQVLASSFDGSEWSSATLLGSSMTQPFPRVKIDGDGNGIAVWDCFDGANLTLQTARFDGSIWSETSILADLGTTNYSSLPNLEINDAGFAVAGWLSSSLQLMGSTYNPNTLSWSSAYPISERNIPLSSTVMAPISIDSKNQLTAILPLSDRIDISSFNALNPPPAPINTFMRLFSPQAMAPNIAQTGSSSYWAFLAQAAVSNYLISATSSGDGTWNFLVAAHPNAAATNLAIMLHPLNHRGGAAWQLSNGSIQASFYNFVNWELTSALSSQGSSPSVAFYQDATDHLVVIWDDQTSGPNDHTIFSSEYDVSTQLWSAPIAISQTSAFAEKTQLAILPNGKAIAAWIREDSTIEPMPRKILEFVTGSP